MDRAYDGVSEDETIERDGRSSTQPRVGPGGEDGSVTPAPPSATEANPQHVPTSPCLPLRKKIRSGAVRVAGGLGLLCRPGRRMKSQDCSFLCRLPPELRERIWIYVLAPSEYSNPAHFHVYGDVYDACTYEDNSKNKRMMPVVRRKKPRQVSLLLTCRGIYQEALPILYGTSDFTLVLLSGSVRPDQGRIECRCLGELRDLHDKFRLMRNITVVVQPGPKPNVDKYEARIASFLAAIDHGKHAKRFCLMFNFVHHMSPAHDRGLRIIRAFAPLGQHVAPSVRAGKSAFHLSGGNIVDTREGAYAAALHALAEQLGGVRWNFWIPIPWNTSQRLEEHVGRCQKRGAWGAYRHSVPRAPSTLKRDLAWLATGFAILTVTLPISVPLIAYGSVKRMIKKGEL